MSRVVSRVACAALTRPAGPAARMRVTIALWVGVTLIVTAPGRGSPRLDFA